jgi:hypothetical protein
LRLACLFDEGGHVVDPDVGLAHAEKDGWRASAGRG